MDEGALNSFAWSSYYKLHNDIIETEVSAERKPDVER